MEESNRRVLQPWRIYLPTPAWWAFNSRIRQLNGYITSTLRARWASRQAGPLRATEHPDLLDRILTAVEVRTVAGLTWRRPRTTHARRTPEADARLVVYIGLRAGYGGRSG